MYALFEYIFDYEDSIVNLIALTDDYDIIKNFLDSRPIHKIMSFDDKVIYFSGDRRFTLVKPKLNTIEVLEVM